MGKFFNRRKSDQQNVTPANLMSFNRMPDNDDCDLAIPAIPGESSIEAVPLTPPETRLPTAKPSPPQDAAIFTLIGASGGVGATSLASQIAYELAVRNTPPNPMGRPHDPQVCLIDLDFETGAATHHLDLPPSLNISDLTGDASRIDSAFTSASISSHSTGISLLATPNQPGGAKDINPLAVLALLDAASKLYKYVIVDMPRYEQAWTLPVMLGSDFVGMVTELTVPALHLTRLQMDQAQSRLGERQTLYPIISKYERRSLRNSLRTADAESALKRKVWSTICADHDSSREALNCGAPIGFIRPDSRLAKDGRRFVDQLESFIEEARPKVEYSTVA